MTWQTEMKTKSQSPIVTKDDKRLLAAGTAATSSGPPATPLAPIADGAGPHPRPRP